MYDILLKNFSYDSETGQLRRITRKNSNGSFDKDGYLIMKFRRKQYKAHRLIWYMVYGNWPKYTIDHINGNRADNRIANLRDVPIEINNQNARHPVNKDTGVVGVYLDKCTKGLKKQFTTKRNKKTYRFYTLEDALRFKQTTI